MVLGFIKLFGLNMEGLLRDSFLKLWGCILNGRFYEKNTFHSMDFWLGVAR